MDTLLNVHTRRGGKNPFCAGFTSSTSPEVQSPQAENSYTEVSLNFVLEPKQQWFVMRATYGRTDKACEEFEKVHVRTYVPTHYAIREVDGKKKRVKVLLLPNIIFAHTRLFHLRNLKSRVLNHYFGDYIDVLYLIPRLI